MKVTKFKKSNNLFKISKNFGKIIIFIAIMLHSYRPIKTFSNTLNDKPFILSTDYLDNDEYQDYILGVGDTIEVEISRSYPSYTTTTFINPSGTINLPEINRIYINGLSISELSSILNQKYSTILKNPNVKISIVKYRPVQVYIDGEVQNPGLYEFSKESNNNNINKKDTFQSFPTLFAAVKKSGGITNYADLSNVEIIRIDTISNGGGRKKAEVNFLNFFNSNNNNSNLVLFDGDIIRIKKTNLQFVGQISKALQSNLNEKYINIIVNGQVENGGTFKVNKNSTLNEAILYAGGFTLGKGKIKIISFQKDGSLIKKNIFYDPKAKRGSEANPKLQSGDVILVDKNNLKRTNDLFTELVKPFANILSVYGGIRVLSD